MLLTIVVFLLILSVLVLIHEAGHFFMAKKMGVKVEEFGFGFPPRIFGKKFGETIYSINLLPIGGFVKLYGEDEAGGGRLRLPAGSIEHRAKGKGQRADDRRAFFAKSSWKRFVIVIAGVVMNFLLATVIISYLLVVEGVPVYGNNVIVGAVIKNSPAEKIGIKKGDIIVSINNIKITTPEQLIKITKANLGKNLILQFKTKDNIKISNITPRVKYPSNEGAMGIAISSDMTIKKYPWYQAPFIGFVEALNQAWAILVGLGAAVSQLVLHGSVPKEIAGPIGIAQLTGQFVRVGFNAVLSLVALLSLNLAVLNVLPIPALDGGRLFFIFLEMITRKKVNKKFEEYTHSFGMVFLLLLIVLITFHDIIRVILHQPLLP